MKIAIIGGGNLGVSILSGLLNTGQFNPASLWITRRRVKMLSHWKEQGVNVESDNPLAVDNASLILLTVKPHQADAVMQEIGPGLTEQQILVSAVTGYKLSSLTARTKAACFRIMPNTAISIGESMTCIAGNQQPIAEEVNQLLGRLGKTLVIPEELMDAATILGACGIAFALRFMRALTQGGIEIGFHAETAQAITAQTMKGAAALILQSGQHPEKEIDKVTTPMGVTISGLNEMEHHGFSSSLIKGILSSYKKIESMRNQES